MTEPVVPFHIFLGTHLKDTEWRVDEQGKSYDKGKTFCVCKFGREGRVKSSIVPLLPIFKVSRARPFVKFRDSYKVRLHKIRVWS